jgi:ribosomal protein L11 methyltransferase
VAYISFLISIDPSQHEIEIAQLHLLGVDSFVEHDEALEAFIDVGTLPELEQEIEHYLKLNAFPYEKKIHHEKDWNAEWEKNFSPIAIGNQLLVRAAFHPQDKSFSQELIISPKMAFGTGHHETTSMILEWLLDQDLKGYDVLDFGCGTGILGIYAAKQATHKVVFVDNDPLSTENTAENILLNQLPEMKVILGSFDGIPNEQYDLILANITRNVLSEGLLQLANHLKSKGKIVMSGFLLQDAGFMIEKIRHNGLQYIEQKQKGDWLCIIAEKQ